MCLMMFCFCQGLLLLCDTSVIKLWYSGSLRKESLKKKNRRLNYQKSGKKTPSDACLDRSAGLMNSL